MKIQEEVRKNPHKFKIEEIRKKEVTMDINQQKEPEIAFKLPPKIKLEEEIENDFLEHGKESQQNKFIEELCASELKIYYFNEIQEPTEMEKKCILLQMKIYQKLKIVKRQQKQMMLRLMIYLNFGII